MAFLNAQGDDLNSLTLELARLESDILSAREATALAEAKAMNAATALALAQKRASIAKFAAAPSAQQRKATDLAETVAFSMKNILFAIQQQGLYFLILHFHHFFQELMKPLSLPSK